MAEATDKNGKVTRRKSGEGLLDAEEEDEAGLPGKKRGRKGKELDAKKGASGGAGAGGEETRGRAAELAEVGPCRYQLPRHRLPLNSRDEGSTCVSGSMI